MAILVYKQISSKSLKNKITNKNKNGNYTRMLRAILNKSWRQHPTRHQLYGHLLEKQGRTHQWCTPMDPRIWPRKKQHDQLELTYSSYVRIRDVALKTCQKQWMIGRSGERGSGISVLAERHDDDDIYIYIYIYIYLNVCEQMINCR